MPALKRKEGRRANFRGNTGRLDKPGNAKMEDNARPDPKDKSGVLPSPNISQIMHNLACLLIPQEIFPQSARITDMPLLLKFPCEINILRDLCADL
jgi:hypothetical protein